MIIFLTHKKCAGDALLLPDKLPYFATNCVLLLSQNQKQDRGFELDHVRHIFGVQ